MSNYITNFLKSRFIHEDIDLNEYVDEAITLLESCDEFVRETVTINIETLNSTVDFAIMHDMYERSYEYACGSLSLLVIGQLQSCEASCRTAIEGAVNLHYVSLGDSIGKIISYFKNHFEVERKQNVNWKTAVDAANADEEAKDHHRALINVKNEALDAYEAVVKKAMAEYDINIDSYEPSWPSAFDRFRLINDEIGYRTTYVALCSQSHNDPEDLLNRFMCRAINNDGFTSAKKAEQYFFSLYMVLQAVKYHIMASAMYLGKYNFSCEKLADKYNKALEILSTAEEHKSNMLNELTG